MIGLNYLGKMGQLGNQMFQYAALKGIAAKHNYKTIIPNHNELIVDALGNKLRIELFDAFDIPCGPMDIGIIPHNRDLHEPHYHFSQELLDKCPDNVSLVPGTVIPKSPGSAGLQPIATAGRFDVADLVLNDMRNNIKRALYNEMLGDPNKTPATATEIAERMADLSRQIGSAFGRLQSELVQPVLQRVIYILKKQGRIEIPTVNGRQVKVRSVSPLSQGQAKQDINNTAQWMQLVQQSFGPEIMNLLVSGEEVASHLAKKFNVPDSLIRDANERQELVRLMQQAQQLQQAQQMSAPQEGEEVVPQ